MLVTKVLSYAVYVFDDGIPMQRLWQESYSCFGKEGDINVILPVLRPAPINR
jgi:hypothetical protein